MVERLFLTRLQAVLSQDYEIHDTHALIGRVKNTGFVLSRVIHPRHFHATDLSGTTLFRVKDRIEIGRDTYVVEGQSGQLCRVVRKATDFSGWVRRAGGDLTWKEDGWRTEVEVFDGGENLVGDITYTLGSEGGEFNGPRVYRVDVHDPRVRVDMLALALCVDRMRTKRI